MPACLSGISPSVPEDWGGWGAPASENCLSDGLLPSGSWSFCLRRGSFPGRSPRGLVIALSADRGPQRRWYVRASRSFSLAGSVRWQSVLIPGLISLCGAADRLLASSALLDAGRWDHFRDRSVFRADLGVGLAASAVVVVQSPPMR
jgi:hypothetical protein